MSKTGLYLMGYKGLGCLRAAGNNRAYLDKIAFVTAAKDKAVVNDYFSDIRQLATDLGLPFYERSNELPAEKATHSIAISWRWLINNEDNSLIVFHDSLLPKYRGFNPLVTALIEGDEQVGVTAIRANKEFDKGNIIGQKKIPVNYPMKIAAATEIVSKLYEELFIEILDNLSKGKLTETAQDESTATYSLWRDEEDYLIDWNAAAERIKRMIDATGFPYKGAKSLYEGKWIRISDATIIDDLTIVNRTAGKILFIHNNQPVVVCGSGLLRIDLATAEDSNDTISFNKLRSRLL